MAVRACDGQVDWISDGRSPEMHRSLSENCMVNLSCKEYHMTRR